jgi:hypothetical protein
LSAVFRVGITFVVNLSFLFGDKWLNTVLSRREISGNGVSCLAKWVWRQTPTVDHGFASTFVIDRLCGLR